MPVVVMRAVDLGRTGYETRDQLDEDTELKARSRPFVSRSAR